MSNGKNGDYFELFAIYILGENGKKSNQIVELFKYDYCLTAVIVANLQQITGKHNGFNVKVISETVRLPNLSTDRNPQKVFLGIETSESL